MSENDAKAPRRGIESPEQRPRPDNKRERRPDDKSVSKPGPSDRRERTPGDKRGPGDQGKARPEANDSRDQGKRRRRRRHGSSRPDVAAPVTKPRHLNLDLPATEPLAADEQREMVEHLTFLRQFKPYLGMSLNATEDLLVNGAKPPTDRGICKHLLSKVDRRAVERALGREAIRTSPPLRAKLLAGVVRISPDVPNLLGYLDALTSVADRRDAAGAFGATIQRIDFGTISAAQMGDLLAIVEKTFDGHDRIQALFGMLENESFRRAMERTAEALPESLRSTFAPLAVAHRVVIRGYNPRETAERTRAQQGIAIWLGSPERVLRNYPVDVRRRLVEYALGDIDLGPIAKPVRLLVDSFPREEAWSVDLALALYDKLIACRQDDIARGLLNVLLQAHPNLSRAKRRQEILAWPRIGRLALLAESRKADRLRRVFSLDLGGFVWARFGAPADAQRLESEADLQAQMMVPGVAACLGHGTGHDATPYVLLAPGGRMLQSGAGRNLTLREALAFAVEGIKILYAVAAAGVELPDASLVRFAAERAPTSLCLIDLDGARTKAAEACLSRAGELAMAFCRELLGGPMRGLRRDLPRPVVELLAKPVAGAELVKSLVVYASRSWDIGAEAPNPSTAHQAPKRQGEEVEKGLEQPPAPSTDTANTPTSAEPVKQG